MKYIFITTIVMVMSSCGVNTQNGETKTYIPSDTTQTCTDTTNTVELLLDSLENISTQ